MKTHFSVILQGPEFCSAVADTEHLSDPRQGQPVRPYDHPITRSPAQLPSTTFKIQDLTPISPVQCNSRLPPLYYSLIFAALPVCSL